MMLTLLLALATSIADPIPDPTIKLNTACPPSFERTATNTCQLFTRYDAYDSLHNQGVGGTQTALPKARDGFSPQQIDLGRYLFFDPLLSGNHRQACASCHQPEQGFTDGKALSTGSHGDIGTRSAPSLWNVGFLKKLFWDARADSLEQQALIPLFASHEMANTAEQLLADLGASRDYPALFAQAFPESPQLELAQVATALAAFQSSLISLNSRYDQYAHGYHQALDDEEIKGLNVFRSFVARCAECHTPPLFTNQQIAVIGTPEPAGMPFDQGAGNSSDKTKLRGAFKVPSLRNIARTAPYMHSGRFATLEEAAEFYTKGRGHAVADHKLLLHWHIWEPKLTPEEIGQISKFLHSLTDESLMPMVPTRLPSGLPLPVEILGPSTAEAQTPTDLNSKSWTPKDQNSKTTTTTAASKIQGTQP
jgi:cytochrome c peroxidase